MVNKLTYSDRELLLQTFDSLKDAWHGDDEKLLADACTWAKSLEPSCGFEHSLTRDIAVLSKYLISYKADYDLSDIARGGLLYVLRASGYEQSRLGALGLLGDAFITSFAVHEIRVRLDENAIYNPPRLTFEEQKHAENLFLELAEKPISSDQHLIEKSRSVCDGLANLATCGLFQRFKRNVEFLISVISNNDWSKDQRCYARAALSYLICEEDTIDDRLGIVGYLDDNFIAQMAVDLIDPNRDPWVEILDLTVGAWPFLNSMVIDDGSGGRPVSEYMIINSAIACPVLRGNPNLTILVAPSVGPIPLLLGFIASLGLIQNSGQREISENLFNIGQKVLVDNNAIAVFAGIKDINGHRRFGLTQDLFRKGHYQPCTHWWPISFLRRLTPADWSRSTRGEITYDLSKSGCMLPALEYLFNASRSADIAAVKSKVLVVTPVTVAGALAKQFKFYNYPLKDVVPMGNIVDNQIKPWSNSFGQQEPFLLFTHDVDIASVYAEEHTESIDTIIVDMTGRNSGKFSSLSELKRMDFRTIVVIPESSASDFSFIDNESTNLWEWDSKDFTELLWPNYKMTNADGIIVRYESRLQTRASAKPITMFIDCSIVDELFESIRHLKLIAQQREEDPLAELDDLVALAFGVSSRMFRSAIPLTENIPSYIAIENSINKIVDISNKSLYLSIPEKTAVTDTKDLIQTLFEKFKLDNPKAAALQELINAKPEQAIICPDARLLVDLERTYGNLGIRILSDYNPEDESTISGAIIPGWFRKDRMAKLLVPPVIQPLTLLLYNLELRWHADFCIERQKSKKRRSKYGKRSKVFPGIKGWAKLDYETAEPAEDEYESSFLRELEAIQGRIHAARRKHAYQTAKSDGSETEVAARLVLFEGGAHAFLRDSYRATVVTHLLDSIVEEKEKENAEVRHMTVTELKPNDALLFNRRSDRDVIRTTADDAMPKGLRAIATAWQSALVSFTQRENLKAKELWERLKSAGCCLHLQTIRSWLDNDDMIAPRQYERDIGIIAKITGDPYLNSNLNTVLESINIVFGEHQRASHKLAQQVLNRTIEILREEHSQSKLIELESDIVVLRVVEIDDNETFVRLSIVNSLQESEQWHV
ncbi:DrmE family protein [bacterium]|nr:DrmE family protein [bacterium]